MISVRRRDGSQRVSRGTAHHSSTILMEMSFRMMFFCVAVRAEEPTLAYFAQDLILVQIGQ